MTVRIVADSCSDITSEVAQKLGIEVVPLYARFGDEVYHDNVDFALKDFYHKPEQSATPSTPSTATIATPVLEAEQQPSII